MPVAVVVQPVEAGVLVIRRGEGTGRGHLALPGGFVDWGETWQEACARELREETGIVASAATVELFSVQSSSDGYLLVFGRLPSLRASELPAFVRTAEIWERLVVEQPVPLAFPLHEAMLRQALEGLRRPGR